MIIEVAGAPGAGKTTLLPTMLRTCESAGLRAYTVEQAARVFARRTVLGTATALLPAALRRRALWALYYLLSAAAAVRVFRSQPGLARYVRETQRARPPAADVRQRRVVYWYVRTAGTYGFLRAKRRPGEVVVIDEGFVHRAIQLHASAVEHPEPAQISAYVDLTPHADLLVAVSAPVEVCRQRVHARGPWKRLDHRSAEEIDRFVESAHRTLGLAVEAVRRSRRPAVQVENAGDLDAARADLRRRLSDVLGHAGRTSEAGWRPAWFYLPRPTRVADTINARVRPPVIDEETCRAVLEQYDLGATGRPANLPIGARNRNVVVRTSDGRKVLRRYRETTRAASLRYEHSVLQELERRRFPAVRVATTRSGDTVAHHEGGLYALFDFSEGISLSSCAMSAASRLRLLETAAATLARLHHELAGFTPQGAHHLGFGGAAGGDALVLEWHLEKLAALAARDADASGSGREHHVAMSRQQRAIASRLSALHESLEEADLPSAIIHGDYGIHNLRVSRDGRVVVHDFELARREWRLVDLVIFVSRMAADGAGIFGDARSRAFLDGYRRRAQISAEEWRHLPVVWEYYRLTGAIRSWDNYFRYGSEHRLATARLRISEAARVREEARAR